MVFGYANLCTAFSVVDDTSVDDHNPLSIYSKSLSHPYLGYILGCLRFFFLRISIYKHISMYI